MPMIPILVVLVIAAAFLVLITWRDERQATGVPVFTRRPPRKRGRHAKGHMVRSGRAYDPFAEYDLADTATIELPEARNVG